MPCESTNQHRLGKTPSMSLLPLVHRGVGHVVRRTSILHVLSQPSEARWPFAVLQTRSTSTDLRLPHRTSEIRHRFAPGVAQNFTVVATKAVSGSRPDLPRYPSHTPNEQHFEVITARSATACKGSLVQFTCLRNTKRPSGLQGALIKQRLHHLLYTGSRSFLEVEGIEPSSKNSFNQILRA